MIYHVSVILFHIFFRVSFSYYMTNMSCKCQVFGCIMSGSKIVKRLRRRQYDPAIIERTIGLVLGPFTALYRSFLKRCTLTNKAVGTI